MALLFIGTIHACYNNTTVMEGFLHEETYLVAMYQCFCIQLVHFHIVPLVSPIDKLISITRDREGEAGQYNRRHVTFSVFM